MRKSKVLTKLRSGEFARVCALGHFLPFFVRYAAHFRYDAIWLDLEHRAMSSREVQTLLGLCYFHDIDCMLRPPILAPTPLYRYLEDGATGFLVPFMSDAGSARQVVAAVKFPPLGNRGFDGAGLDADYGLEAWKPGSTYTSNANHETFVVGQIETSQAVANVEEIAAVPGIDALFIGPGDLGLRLSMVRGPAGTTLTEAAETVARAARKHSKAWGIAPTSLQELVHYRRMGAQIVPWGNDFALVKVLETCSKELEAAAR